MNTRTIAFAEEQIRINGGGDLSSPAETAPHRQSMNRTFRIYRRFLPFLKPYWPQLLLAGAALGGSLLMSLLEPWPLKLIFDHILWGKPLPARAAFVPAVFGSDRSALLGVFCGALVAIVLFDAVFSYLQRYLFSAVGQSLVNEVRLSLFDHLQSLSLLSLGSRKTGDLVLRLTSDIKALRELLVSQIQHAAKDMLRFVSTVAVMLWMDWQLTLLALAIAPLLYWLSHHFSRQIEAAARKRQSKESEVASIVQETMTSIAVVQAFTQEKREKKRLKHESKEGLRASLETVRLGGVFNQSVKILNTFGLALVVWCGVSHAISGRLTPGDIIVFAAYVANLYGPINDISDLIIEFMESLVSGERILELFETDAGIKDAPDAVPAPAFRGEVTFENVTFGYERGRPVLRNVSFTAKPGNVVALVGLSGAGKSTITKLLLRFFDPWEGRVLIDGQDVRRFQLKSLRKQISLVPQDPILFRRTLAENISYGNTDSNFEDIVAAAKAAQAHEFIESLPHGYDTVLGERGDRISGGQRQRIALARAILREARILLLDEPATGIDAITEAQLNETLRCHLDSKTVFVIAHRFSTAQRADLILVIEDGKAAEQGTHAELLVRSALYRQLYKSQSAELLSGVPVPAVHSLEQEDSAQWA